jgi:arylsulfatase A-like enzyme/Flp pilus assembly protein TadD
VIVVTLDTTRADRVGAYGGTAVPTPHLDRIAREGTLFEDASSVVPLTLPSHATLFTGRFPASHGARHNGFYRLRDAELTLAETLKAAGFSTAAFLGAYVLNRGFGLEQGFDLYVDIKDPGDRDPSDLLNEAQRTAGETNARLFEWLEVPPEGRFFLWIHYFDPHAPYAPPEEAGRELHGVGYDREISYLDACFGDVLERLDSAGLLERSILVVVGDHGESLGEHREATHGVFLYEAAMHVPWMIRAPGLVPQGKRVSGPVSTADLTPTVLDLLGLPPLPGAQGESLVPRIEGRSTTGDEVVFAESTMPRIEFGWSELRMARDVRFKYVQAPREELYDLADDPHELRNLASVDVERTRRMAAAVEEWVNRTTAAAAPSAQRSLSSEELERLRSLGYLAGDAIGREDGALAGLDPKDGMEYSIRVEEARLLRAAGELERAIPILEEVLHQDPTHSLAVGMLLKSYVEVERYEDAERAALAAIEAGKRASRMPSNFLRQNRLRLAALYHLQGRESEAASAYREALEGWVADDSVTSMSLQGLKTAVGPDVALQVFDGLLETDPDHPVALSGKMEIELARGDREAAMRTAQHVVREGAASTLPGGFLVEAGRLLLDGGDPEGAADLFQVAIEKLGRQADLLGYLGTALLSSGRVDEARRSLEEASRLRPDDPRPHFYLGNIALLRNEEQQARAHYREALAHDPDWTEPLDNLALWLVSRGRSDEAATTLEEALERNPDDARARELLRRLQEGKNASRGPSR